MSDNATTKETRQEEQQDLQHQQQDLFDELSREKTQAEKDLKDDQEAESPDDGDE